MNADRAALDPPAGLLVVFRPRLTLAFFSELPTDGFQLDGARFADLGWTSSEGTLEGEMAGFYDWLRSEETVRGVRFCPLGPAEAVAEQVASLPYVSVGPDGNVEVYFGGDRTFDPDSSQDQAFGANRVYRVVTGEFAVSFSLDGLEPWELASISYADAAWGELR